MQVKATQAARMVIAYIKAQCVPMIHGSPGIGKSQIVHQIAEENNLKLIDVRLSQCDPTDLSGFPSIDLARQKAGYVPMDTFPLEGEPIPEGYNGWLLFFDEATSSPRAVQAASYKIFLDRKIGQQNLHKNCAVVAAGNLETDGAIVEEMSTALQSRLAHMELVLDAKEWVDWASKNDVHHFITDFIKFKPGNLFTFKRDHTDFTYACPRTWVKANNLLKQNSLTSPDMLPLLAGKISEGVAREFMVFCKIYASLPKVDAIIQSPGTVPVPDEPSILFALTGSLAHNATEENLEKLMAYIDRLPAEFQVVTGREIIQRNKKMLGHPIMQKWLAKSAQQLF